MKGLMAIAGILGMFVTLPIALYLQYHVFQLVHATDVMWFLYFIQIPVVIIINVITEIAKAHLK